MSEVVRFPSSDDVPTGYSKTLVTLSEVDAIVMKPLDKVATSIAEVGGNTQGTLYINFTKGNLTGVNIRLYGSYVGDAGAGDWYQEVVETDAAGVATLDKFVITLTATAQIAYHFPIGAYQAMKITVEGTGADNTGSVVALHVGLRTN